MESAMEGGGVKEFLEGVRLAVLCIIVMLAVALITYGVRLLFNGG